jgi:hypothetical protein
MNNSKQLEDSDYEMIKVHILYPDENPLSEEKKKMLDRVISASKILDKMPILPNAISLHLQQHADINSPQAHRDMRLAVRLFNSLHVSDFDYWHKWLINDIVKNIQECRKRDDPSYRRVISMEHLNLIRAIGEKPEEIGDPHRNEKHQFYILMQHDNRQIKIDVNNLKDLPVETLQELNNAIWGGGEITESDAEEIMKT